MLHPVLDPAARKSLEQIATGLPASPGAAVGVIVFTADEAGIKAKNGPVILVPAGTQPDDIHGMGVSTGNVTTRGGNTRHAAAVRPRVGMRVCRSEDMFFAEDRLEHMQAMILATDEKSRRKALQKLLPMQRSDFAGLFKAMNGFPVVIRTLDPPLHEFLPKREELMVDIAKLPHAGAQLKKEMSKRYGISVGSLKKQIPVLLRRVEELHEFNPILGHLECRQGGST